MGEGTVDQVVSLNGDFEACSCNARDSVCASNLLLRLQISETMVELDLEDNCIGPEGAIYIAEAVQDNTNITHLVYTLCPRKK